MPQTLDKSVSVTTPSAREICVSREFRTSAALLFDVHTKPELIRQWLLGPDGWSMPVCRVDLQVGGGFRYEWRHASGQAMAVSGEYLELERPVKIVHREAFDEAWHDGDCRVTTTFDEDNGITVLAMTMRYDSEAIRDQVLESPAVGGMSQGYERLEELLATLRAA